MNPLFIKTSGYLLKDGILFCTPFCARKNSFLAMNTVKGCRTE